MLNANPSPTEHFKLMSIIDAIPRECRQIIRQTTQHLPSLIGDPKMENAEVALSKVSSKLLYEDCSAKKKGFRRNFRSFCLTERKYIPCLLITVTVTIETKIRELIFQYKELNNIVFTNEQMVRLKMTDSP